MYLELLELDKINAPRRQASEADGGDGGGSHHFNPTILRESDIRGIVGKTLFTEDALALGRAFGTIVRACGGSRVCVGYDGRLSSPDLEAALVEGLAQTGITVHRIGRGPTPMLYFSVHELDTHGGIMVTGSHNPPDYNGFKMMFGKASFFGRDIKRLGEIATSGAFASGNGVILLDPQIDAYVERLLEGCDRLADLTVAWDPGNGAAGEVVERLTARLPGRHLLLNEKTDGTLPAHHPDPTVPENLVQLQRTVREEECDLGIAFDGDGDRIGVVDGKGRILWGDQLMMLFAEDVLRDHPGATVIADVKASQTLFDRIAELGGKPLMWKTGHSLIKTKMKKTNAPLAGEMSGHIFFADKYYGFDDAPYAALRLLGILARSTESLEELRDAMPRVVNTPELRFECADDYKFTVVERVRSRLEADNAAFDDIDGVRVTTDDGWWLLRASNTQEVLVARCESQSEEGLERLMGELTRHLRQSGHSGDICH